jgi:restriction system protein
MSIPTIESLLIPLLIFTKNGETRTLKGATIHLASLLKLSDKDLSELQPSGVQTKFEKRVGWARYYLGRAGYIRSVRRGEFSITKRGLEILQNKSAHISLTEIGQITARKK